MELTDVYKSGDKLQDGSGGGGGGPQCCSGSHRMDVEAVTTEL